MLASYSEYLKKKAMLESGGDFSEAAIAKVKAALAEYEQKYLEGGKAELPLSPDEGASAINQAAGLPSQEAVAQSLEHAPRQGEDLTSLLDPGFALPPQALAVQPATTHPRGDKAAEDEWLRGDLSNPNGLVVVYDAPMAQVQKDLAENPALLDALGMSISPGARVEKGDSVEQSYQQFKWREAADAAAKAGKTAYRYSKAPWLADGKNASVLDSLSTKLTYSTLPAAQTAQAFVLGVDDLGFFGAGQAAAKTGFFEPSEESKRYTTGPKRESKDEVVGGIPADAPAAERNKLLKQEHPDAYTAGQVGAAAPALAEAGAKGLAKGVGALSEAAGQRVARAAEGIGSLGEWLPADRLWSYVMGKPATMVGTAVRGAAAGAASEGVSAGVEGAGNYAGTGDTGMTGGEFGTRVLHGGAAGFGLSLLGGMLHAGAKGVGNWVREGDYYRQLPGTVESLGSEPQFLRGFSTPPAVEAARAEARARPGRPKPIDMIAEKTDKPLGDAVYHEEARTIERVKQQNEEVFSSPEGRLPLPGTELGKQAVTDLRKNTSVRAGERTPSSVAIPNAERPARAVLNMNVDGVSVHPVEGAIPVTPEEAEAWLHPALQDKAVEAAQTKKATKVADTELATMAADYQDDLPMVHTPEEASAAQPPERTPRERQMGPGKEENGLAPVDRYRAPRANQLGEAQQTAMTRVDRYRPPEAPQMGTSETRYSGEPDWRHSPWFEGYDPTPGGPMVKGSREARPGERTGPRPAEAREVGPRGERTSTGAPGIAAEPANIPDAEFTERKARAGKPPPDAKFKRKGAREQVGSTAQELRKAGVKTVYLLPRKYDARRQEAVIQILRTGGGDSEKARRLEKFYQAAKRDRLQRPWQGEPQGYSKLQAQHEQLIDTAKDLRKRVAPKGSAYSATKRHGRPGTDSRNIDAMQRAAEMAGGDQPELVRGARILQPLTELQGLSTFGRSASGGGKRLPYGLSALSDATILRGVYPVTRAIERTPHGGGQVLSRLSLAGLHDARDESDRKSAAPKAKPAPAKPKRKRYSRRRNPEREKP